MVTGSKEYDVYVIVEERSLFYWFSPFLPRPYRILLGKSFASADEARANAELQVNAPPVGKVIGIAADAIVCCKDEHFTTG